MMDAQNYPESIGISDRIETARGRRARTQTVGVRFTLEEEKELAQFAKSEGKLLREWARDAILAQARSARTSEALFTELVATQMLLSVALRATATGQTMKPDDFSKLLTNVRNKKHLTAAEQLAAYADRSGREQ